MKITGFKIVLLGLINSILSWFIASMINSYEIPGIHSTGMVSLIALVSAAGVFILNLSYLFGLYSKNKVTIYLSHILPSALIIIPLIQIKYTNLSGQVTEIVFSVILTNALLSLWSAFWVLKIKKTQNSPFNIK